MVSLSLAVWDKPIWSKSLHISVRHIYWERQNCLVQNQILSQSVTETILKGKNRLCITEKRSWQWQMHSYKIIRGKEGKSLTGWDGALSLGQSRPTLWGAIFPRLRDVKVHMLCWLQCIGSPSVYLSTGFVFLICVSIVCLRPKWGAAYRSGGQISDKI